MLKVVCKVCEGDTELMENSQYVPCKACNEEGYVPADGELMVYVNVYSVTRCYGGPEEGGWYWDRLECIETYPVRNKNSDTIKAELLKGYEHIKEGDISSVLGGTGLAVYIESEPKKSERIERPMYE